MLQTIVIWIVDLFIMANVSDWRSVSKSHVQLNYRRLSNYFTVPAIPDMPNVVHPKLSRYQIKLISKFSQFHCRISRITFTNAHEINRRPPIAGHSF